MGSSTFESPLGCGIHHDACSRSDSQNSVSIGNVQILDGLAAGDDRYRGATATALLSKREADSFGSTRDENVFAVK